MTAACDYKRALDGDRGPNTGGMGSYSPPAFWNLELEAVVRATIMEPLAAQMVKMGCPYRGVLYAGLMLTADGPKVLEFNCRLGDPETQVVLPRLRTDLLEIAFSTVNGCLRNQRVEWSPDPWVGVVLTSEGYPGDYEVGEVGFGPASRIQGYCRVSRRHSAVRIERWVGDQDLRRPRADGDRDWKHYGRRATTRL